jgi:hypothetical protein
MRGAPRACRHAAEQTSIACAIPPQRASHGARPEPPQEHDGGAPAAIEAALSLALQRAAAAYDTRNRWEARVRAALSALLDLFEEQPDLARLCVVESENGGPAALALREDALAILANRIDDGRDHARCQPPPQAAQAVLAGALGAIRARRLDNDRANVIELLDPLVSFIVLAYRGAAAARGELTPTAPLQK